MATPSAYTHMVFNTDSTDSGTGANAVSNIGTPTYTAGKISNALTLDGSTDALNLNALEADIGADTTGSLSFWAKPNGTTGSVFCLEKSAGSPFAFSLFGWETTGGGRYHVVFERTSPGTVIAAYGAAAASGSWHHVVVTQDGSAVKIYTNAVESTTGTNSGDWFSWVTGADNARIGQYYFNGPVAGGWFDGQIDDFRYYQNTVLTQTDVNNIYRGGTGTEADPPPLWIASTPRSQAVIIA